MIELLSIDGPTLAPGLIRLIRELERMGRLERAAYISTLWFNVHGGIWRVSVHV